MIETILDSHQTFISKKLHKLGFDLKNQSSDGFFKKIISPLTPALSRTSRGEGSVFKSLYIYGDVGRGKSMLMKDFFASLKKTPKIYFHFNSFMKAIHEALRDVRSNQFPLPLRERVRVRGKFKDELIEATKRVIQKNRLLCLDEFQVLDVADAMILGRVFSYLFSKKISVVFTSNLHPQELYQNGLQREIFLKFVNEILLKNCEILHLNGSIDYRLQKWTPQQVRSDNREVRGDKWEVCDGKEEVRNSHLSPRTCCGVHLKKRYFISNKKNRAELKKIIETLTNKQKPKITKLKVWGRDLRIKKTFGKIAIFNFDELCRNNLAAADYQVICQNFDLIFLLKLPKLVSEDVNEARRFMLFVDEIYENKTALIILAKTRPEKIYESGIGIEAFKRTVSRLKEMKSDQYWQESKVNKNPGSF